MELGVEVGLVEVLEHVLERATLSDPALADAVAHADVHEVEAHDAAALADEAHRLLALAILLSRRTVVIVGLRVADAVALLSSAMERVEIPHAVDGEQVHFPEHQCTVIARRWLGAVRLDPEPSERGEIARPMAMALRMAWPRSTVSSSSRTGSSSTVTAAACANNHATPSAAAMVAAGTASGATARRARK